MSNVRISIGNLAVRASEVTEAYSIQFGLLNSAAHKKGRQLYAALGGAAELTPRGRAYLEQQFGATGFEGNDARFVVHSSNVESVLAFFKTRDPSMFEVDPTREILDELTTEKIPGMGTILAAEDAAQVSTVFISTVVQPQGGKTSAREVAEVETRRLFHLFELRAPSSVLAKLIKHRSVHLFLPEELHSTNGGRTRGRTLGGADIADNIGLL